MSVPSTLPPSTTPLSSQEREALHTRWSRLPLVLVVLALGISIVLPRLSVRRITRLRNEVTVVVDPAQQLLTEIQLDLALEGTQRRGFLLTGDTGVARELVTTRAHRARAEQQLLGYARRLDGFGGASLARSVTKLASLDRSLDSVVTRSAVITGDELRRQHVIWTVIQAASDTLRTDIGKIAHSRRVAIDRTVNDVELVTAGLLLLGVGATILVARLGSRYRALALRLDENEARFRQITENLSAVVWLSDPDFRRTLYVNGAYERIWGRPRDIVDVSPDALMQGVHPDDRERLRSALADVERRVADVEFRVVRPNGEVRWLWNRGFPVRDSTGRIFRIAGIIEDVTERREHALERERLLEGERAARATAEQQQRDLARLTESHGRLVRGFTHDVKNPLGAADGYLTLLEEGVFGGVEDGQHVAIKKIRDCIRQALELIAQVLQIARTEAGQLEIHRSPTDLVELIREVADAFVAQASAKDIALIAEQQPGMRVVETDSALVRQIVGNLVSNAVKYTQRGGTVAVGVDALAAARAPDEEQLLITVSDNGPGIPSNRLPLLFEEFTRFDTQAAEGAGIGLAIGQRIAQALGGEITVESKVGVGTRFALHLPLGSSRRANVSRTRAEAATA